MTLAFLAFVPLLAFWALLTAAFRRPGANYVGTPLTRAQVYMRLQARFLQKAAVEMAEALRPAIEAATRSMVEWARVWTRTIAPVVEQIRAAQDGEC